MAKVKMSATLPTGEIITRTTARTYTHVVVMRRDLAALREYQGTEHKNDRENYAYHLKRLAVGAGNSYMYKPYGCRPFEVTVTQADIDDSLAKLDGASSFVDYLAKVIARRLAAFDRDHEGRAIGGYRLCGWCGRPDLADKLAKKEAAGDFVHSVEIIPVN